MVQDSLNNVKVFSKVQNEVNGSSEYILVQKGSRNTNPRDVKNWLDKAEKETGKEIEEGRAYQGVLQEAAKLGSFVNRDYREVSYVCHAILVDHNGFSERGKWRLYEWSNEIEALYPEIDDQPEYYVVAGTFEGSTEAGPREQSSRFNYENSLSVKNVQEHLLNRDKLPEELLRDYKETLDRNKEL